MISFYWYESAIRNSSLRDNNPIKTPFKILRNYRNASTIWKTQIWKNYHYYKDKPEQKTIVLKPLVHSFNELKYTFLIKPLRFPVLKIRLLVINCTYLRTQVHSFQVKPQPDFIYFILYFLKFSKSFRRKVLGSRSNFYFKRTLDWKMHYMWSVRRLTGQVGD